jgi:hypothetical protein
VGVAVGRLPLLAPVEFDVNYRIQPMPYCTRARSAYQRALTPGSATHSRMNSPVSKKHTSELLLGREHRVHDSAEFIGTEVGK